MPGDEKKPHAGEIEKPGTVTDKVAHEKMAETKPTDEKIAQDSKTAGIGALGGKMPAFLAGGTDFLKTGATKTRDEAEDGEDYDPQEEVKGGNYKLPGTNVVEQVQQTGEEDETVEWSQRAKLYRFAKPQGDQANKGPGEWKERGLGEAKLLKNGKTGRVRFLLRQEKTLKIVANHYVIATDVFCKLKPNMGSEKTWVWTVPDCADEPPVVEQFAIKFGDADKAKEFEKQFNKAGEVNSHLVTPA